MSLDVPCEILDLVQYIFVIMEGEDFKYHIGSDLIYWYTNILLLSMRTDDYKMQSSFGFILIIR